MNPKRSKGRSSRNDRFFRWLAVGIGAVILIGFLLEVANGSDLLIVPLPPENEEWYVAKTFSPALDTLVCVVVLRPILTERQWFKLLCRIGAPGGFLMTVAGWLFARWRRTKKEGGSA